MAQKLRDEGSSASKDKEVGHEHHHEPTATRPMARLPRRGDPGRRDLRPPAAQRPSDRATRTLAKKGGKARRLIDGPAPLRSDHDPPIYVITIERSERSR